MASFFFFFFFFWILINTAELEFPVTTRTCDPVLKAQRRRWSINIGGENQYRARAHTCVCRYLLFSHKTSDLDVLYYYYYCNNVTCYYVKWTAVRGFTATSINIHQRQYCRNTRRVCFRKVVHFRAPNRTWTVNN